MLLAYLDESYDSSRYWITALVCPDRSIKSLVEALDSVMGFGDYPLDPRTELHGYDLFHGEKDFERLKSQPRRRIKIYGDALQAIASQPDAQLFIRGIDRIAQQKRYTTVQHPHRVVLTHLLEQIDLYAAAQGEYLLVIADEVEGAATHRSSLWDYQHQGTWGYKARVLTQIADTIHFTPSNWSRPIQAADLVSFLNYRICSGIEKDPRAIAASSLLWNRIKPQVRHQYCWVP